MRRLLSLALAAAVSLTLTSCAAGYNKRINTKNMAGANNGTTAQRMSLRNNAGNIGTTTVKYRDGVYRATGNPHNNGNEQATIIVRNGRIASVVLTNIGIQNATTNQIGNGTPTPQMGRTNNQTGDGMGMNKPGRTETGNDNPAGINFQGANNQSTTGVSYSTGIAGGLIKGDAGDDAINEIRTRLSHMMFVQQRADVPFNPGYEISVSRYDAAYLNNMIANWKLAAGRALSQATR